MIETRSRRRRRLNWRGLILFALIVGVAIGGAVAARKLRTEYIAAKAIADARSAVQRLEWPAACSAYRRYLAKRPKDAAVLREFATAQLHCTPLDSLSLGAAREALRRITSIEPGDIASSELLLRVMAEMGDPASIEREAARRLDRDAEDASAALWLARSLVDAHPIASIIALLRPHIERFENAPSEAAPEIRTFIDSCALIASAESIDEQAALDWLDRAVATAPGAADARLARALYLRRTNRDAEAIRAEAAAAAELPAVDPYCYLGLATIWFANGFFERAQREIDRAAVVDAKSIRQVALDPGDWAAALLLARSELALRRGPTADDARQADDALAYVLAPAAQLRVLPNVIKLHVAALDRERARQRLAEFLALRRAGTSSDETRDATMLQAIVAAAFDEPLAVVKLLEPLAAAEPRHAPLWRMLAEAFARLEMSDARIRCLHQYIALRMDDGPALMKLVQAYMERGDWNRAVDAARLGEAAQRGDVEHRILQLRARTARAAAPLSAVPAERLDALRAEALELATAHPRRVELRVLVAAIDAAAGQLAEAEAELRRASEQCDDPLPANVALASLLSSRGDADDAIRIATSATQRNPAAIAAWNTLTDALLAAGRRAEARLALERAAQSVQSVLDRRRLARRLAALDLEAGDIAAGVARLRKLVELDPSDIQSRVILLSMRPILADAEVARALVKDVCAALGDEAPTCRLCDARLALASPDWRAHQLAITSQLEACIRDTPMSAVSRLLLADLKVRLGDESAAEHIYRAAIESIPDSVELADRWLSLLERQNRLGEAATVLDRVRLTPQARALRRIGLAISAGDFDNAIDALRAHVDAGAAPADAQILLARLTFHRTGDAAAALAILDRAAAEQDAGLAAVAARVEILHGSGDASGAARILDQWVALRDDAAAHLLRARYREQIGTFDLAEQDYRALPQRLPDGEGHDLLARFLASRGRRDESLRTMLDGLDKNPNSHPLLRHASRVLAVSEDAAERERGLRLLDELDKRVAEDPEAMMTRAILANQRGDEPGRRDAAALLERVIAIEPGALDAHRGLIALAVEARDLARARELVIRAQGAAPGHAILTTLRAMIEFRLGNSRLAIGLARTILRSEPLNADARAVMIECALASREPAELAEARQALETARKVAPNDELLAHQFARIEIAALAAAGATEELILAADALSAASPQSHSALVTAITSLANTGIDAYTASAVRIASRAVSQAPSSVSLRLAAAFAYRKAADLDAAEQAYRDALAIRADEPLILNDLALLIFERRGEINAPLELIDLALRLAPGDARLLDTRGTILASVPERAVEARADLENALAQRHTRLPERVGTLKRLARLCAGMGDIAASQRYLNEAIRLDPRNQEISAPELAEIRALWRP